MKETKKTDETSALIVVTKDNSNLTNKHTSFDNWICVPNPESLTSAVWSNSSMSLSIVGGNLSPWGICKTHKIIKIIRTSKTNSWLILLFYFICHTWHGKTRVTSYELRVENLKALAENLKARVESLKARIETQKWEFKSTSYKFKSTCYEFESTSYNFKFTSYEFKSTNY